MSIGPTVLSQCAESYRKIRTAARFILGNAGDRKLSEAERVPYQQLPLVCLSQYIMLYVRALLITQ